MTSFLHGAESIQVSAGARPINVAKSSVIGLVGIAPSGTVNDPVLVLSTKDAAKFGSKLTGFTIPQALDQMIAQGCGPIIVVNVFDPTTMCKTNTDESHDVVNGKIKLTDMPVANLVIKKALVTLVLGTDYTVDAYGNVTIIGSTIAEGDTLLATYKALDPTLVTADKIIGELNGTTGVRTGMSCFELCYNMFGFNPKIIVSPGYSTLSTVAAQLAVVASKYRGHYIVDAPVGTTPTGALEGRGPDGAINFNTSDKRAVLAYPAMKGYDPGTDAIVNRPFSAFIAGMISAVDNAEGYWVSPSNHEIKGITGVEVALSAMINDPNSEVNLLNGAGIMTVFNAFGTGFRLWGNRSAAFPTNTHPTNFIAVQRVADVLDESVEWAMLQFIDKPINNALIDSIKESVNAFIRTLVSRGALVDGKCSYDPAKNDPTEVAAGHLVFDISFMPPTPAERITFDSFLDINLLKALGK